MTTKLAASLPKELDSNSLLGIGLDDLAYGGDRVAIIRLRPKQRVEALDHEKENDVTLEVIHVEVMGAQYREAAEQLMQTVRGERTGHVGLPLLPHFYVECPACGGTGEVTDLFSEPDNGHDEDTWDRTCARCSGSGQVEVDAGAVGEQVVWMLGGCLAQNPPAGEAAA